MRRHPHIVILVLCALVGCSAEPDIDAAFARQAGEIWYGIYLDQEKIGYARFASARVAGGYVFSSSAAVRERNGVWTHWEDSERFAAKPPHELLERISSRTRDGVREETRLTRTADGYRLHDAEHDELIALDYRLRDRLATTQTGDRGRTTHALDVSRASVHARRWKPTDEHGQALQDGSGLRRVTLDASDTPTQLTIGSGFRMQREPADLAVLVAEPKAVQGVEVPIDGAMGTPDRIVRLTVRLPAELAELIGSAPNQTVGVVGTDARLTVTRAPERQADLRAPTEPDLALAALRGADVDDATRARKLVALVHGSLTYDAAVMPLGPRDALAKGQGSCRDFASVYAYWARQMGLATRIVTGLVYLGDARRAFGLHAWNEVQLNGTWVAVDPTWNQAPADATHIRLPLEPDAMLRAFEALDHAQFQLVELERATVSG